MEERTEVASHKMEISLVLLTLGHLIVLTYGQPILKSPKSVTGTRNGDVTLQCFYTPMRGYSQESVKWLVRHGSDPVTIFLRDSSGDHIQQAKYRGRLKVSQKLPGDVSLQLNSLQMDDRSHYTCEVTWQSPEGTQVMRDEIIELRVQKYPSNPTIINVEALTTMQSPLEATTTVNSACDWTTKENGKFKETTVGPVDEKHERTTAGLGNENHKETTVGSVDEEQERTTAGLGNENHKETTVGSVDEEQERTTAGLGNENHKETTVGSVDEEQERTTAGLGNENHKETTVGSVDEEQERTAAGPGNENHKETTVGPVDGTHERTTADLGNENNKDIIDGPGSNLKVFLIICITSLCCIVVFTTAYFIFCHRTFQQEYVYELNRVYAKETRNTGETTEVTTFTNGYFSDEPDSHALINDYFDESLPGPGVLDNHPDQR